MSSEPDCPRFVIDLGDGREQIVPLPPTATRHELQLLAFDKVTAMRRPSRLVLGPDDVIVFDENAGSVTTGERWWGLGNKRLSTPRARSVD